METENEEISESELPKLKKYIGKYPEILTYQDKDDNNLGIFCRAKKFSQILAIENIICYTLIDR